MRLTVLGCAGTYPGPRSGCSSYLVEHEGFRLLLDAGNGAVGALQRHAPLLGLDAIYISHLHADHCMDLVSYYYARRFHPDGIPPALPLFGPDDMGPRVESMLGHCPEDLFGSVYALDTARLTHTSIGPFEVELALSNHPMPCHSIRLTVGGRSLVYSGDTGPCPELVALAKGADLLLIEASWPADSACARTGGGVHLTAGQAGEHAARAGVGRTLLTHVVPWCDSERTLEEAAMANPGPMEIAAADRSYDI